MLFGALWPDISTFGLVFPEHIVPEVLWFLQIQRYNVTKSPATMNFLLPALENKPYLVFF